MSVFYYFARDKSGETIKGNYEASDKTMVITMLKNRGYIPIEVKERSALQADINFNFLNNGVSNSDVAIFCRQFASVIEAGIPVLECLDIVRKQTDSADLKSILNRVYEQVQKGKSMSESLREFKDKLPSILINMVEAGEASGTLDKVMARLAIYFTNENKLVNKVKGALTYPIVILVVAFIAVIVLLKYVVPQFQSMFEGTGSTLPLATRMLMKLSEIVSKNWMLIIVLVIGGIIALYRYSKTKSGKFFFDGLMFKIPIISNMYVKMITARFTRTMASLLTSGLPLIQALEITTKVLDNAVMTKHLEKVIEDVTKGVKLSVAISYVRIFPSMVTNMVNIGEESGSIDSILEKTADFFEEETENAVTKLTTLIEPAAILLMAVVVGSIIIAIVQPMFGVFETMKNLQ